MRASSRATPPRPSACAVRASATIAGAKTPSRKTGLPARKVAGASQAVHVSAKVRMKKTASRISGPAPAGQPAGLLHPLRELRLVELVVDVDVQIPHVLLFRCARRQRLQRSTAEEADLHVLREAVEAEKPTLPVHPVEGRVPLHRLAHAGDGARDDRVQPPPDRALPIRHRRDVRLHRCIPLRLRDLGIAAREQARLRLHFEPLNAAAARMSALNAFSSILSSSWTSIARRVFPSRLELNTFDGSGSDAPFAKVSFTTFLYVSPVQMIP